MVMDRLMRMLRNTFIFLIMGLCFFGCSAEENHERQRVVVYAASSLTDVLTTLENRFETSHPEIDVAIAYAGSQALRLRINQGAPADVFISANPEHMTGLLSKGRIRQTQVFAYNRLAVVVPKANPAGIQNPQDLVKAKRLVMGNEEVPIGKYTRQWLLKMDNVSDRSFSQRVLKSVVSQENNVRLLRAKVELGEADAAIVYVTDALSSSYVEYLPIDLETNIRTEYQLGIVSNKNSNAAMDIWLRFLGSDEARGLMEEEGLELP